MARLGRPAAPGDIHLVATPYFDSPDVLKAGLSSAEDQAAAGDLANRDRNRSTTTPKISLLEHRAAASPDSRSTASGLDLR
jgi:hypothetical protein